jgi:xylan 1,4-beta-xylosidase
MNWYQSFFAKTTGLLLASSVALAANQAPKVDFYQFDYEGKDKIFSQKPAKDEFQNPILAGFYPDPSITRKGDDYYLVNSSFSYNPGVPIFHSKDLVHWKSLGYVLTRPSQLPLAQQQTSRGIYAPTIRYHDGTFYMITTLVDVRGNFMVTATDPAGPWSEPILLPEIGGIDPDIFFDDDGRVYIAHNDGPVGEPLYQGHRAIWLWEFDPKTKTVIKNSGRVIVNGGADLSKKPVWVEGPHIYKINGWYYLLCAEGGTSLDHSEVVFRTKSLNEPFVAYSGNPILTQRDLPKDRTNPITSTGHADLIQTAEGEWWAVFLGTRAYDKTAYNTGRETFLLPVTWTDGWPVILPQGQTVPWQLKALKTNAKTAKADLLSGNFAWHDSFTDKQLSFPWAMLRSGTEPFYTLSGGKLSLMALNVSLDQLAQPAFLGRRQQHMTFSASTQMAPPPTNTSGGIVALQNETAHYYFGVKNLNNQLSFFIEQANGAAPQVIYHKTVERKILPKKLTLGMDGDAGKISFYYLDKKQHKHRLLDNADAKILSTEVAGGFVGTFIGLHARKETVPEK